MIRTIIFDFDGVLVESVDIKTRAFGKLFEDEGPDVVRNVIDYHLRNGGVSRYEKFRFYYENFLKRPLTEKKLEGLGREFSRLVISEVVRAPWVKGAREFLEKFHKSLELYVVTGTPHEEIAEIIQQRKMGHFFREVVGTPPRKEALVCAVAQKAGVKKDEIVMVGDSPQDLQGARAAGIRFVGRVESPGSSLDCEEGIIKIPDLRSLGDVLSLSADNGVMSF